MTVNSNIETTLKSGDTEEWLDLYFTRPLGYLWAKLFARLHVHPNIVTIFSIFLGVGAGFCFYFEDLRWTVCGICLLVWANIYDSCDGQLARMTDQKTKLGRILDGFAGDAWFFTIYFFICLRLTPVWGVWIWLLAALAGLVCHAKQCQLADYYRNVHLFVLKGKSGSELDSSAKVKADYKALRWGNDFIQKLFLYFYIGYTKSQEQMTPSFQHLRAALQAKIGEQSWPKQLRKDFRQGSLPLMKYANILTFNTRAIVLYISLLFFVPWAYFIFEITVMNALFFYMRQRHEQLCRQLYQNLPTYEASI